ncbi:21559_t:CDS:2, partial [Gigaspora rosea]
MESNSIPETILLLIIKNKLNEEIEVLVHKKGKGNKAKECANRFSIYK